MKKLFLVLLLCAAGPAVAQEQSGVINYAGGGGGGGASANPSATASDTAVNGTASTFMTSDSAPAVQKGGSAQFGLVKVDGTTITASGGVISAVSTGTGNALFGTATGNTANDFVSMSNTTVGVKDSTYSAASFAPAGQVVAVTGSNPTITAAEWAAAVQFTITGSGRTLTFPASSTLSNNGGALIDTNASSVVVTATTPDTITWNGATTGAAGSVTLPVGGLWAMSTDGAGKLYISGKDVTGTGSDVRATSPTLVTPALGAATATTINGVTIPSTTDTAALLGTAQNWTAQQSNAVTTLSISTATFTPTGASNNYKITLVHASCPCTLANPSATPVAGTSGVIEVIQSATGSDTINTWGSQYLYAGGTSTITFSAGANAKDFLSYYVEDATHILLTTGALNATH